MFRLFSFLLTAADLNLDYLFAVFVYFLCFPVVEGISDFYSSFVLTRRRNFYIIFRSYYSFRNFVSSLEDSLLCLVILGTLLFPFALAAALPYVFHTEDKITLVFEVISLFLLAAGSLMWLSFVYGRKISRENVYFFLSFIIHYVIAYFTKGIYLLYLFPYVCVAFDKMANGKVKIKN